MFKYVDMDLPSYYDNRIYLEDPTEAAYISDLAFAMEGELLGSNVLADFEELELVPNVIIQMSSHLGLEANKFAEMAKRGYYVLKQRAKQLVNYVFTLFLNMLRGTTDVKGVLRSYEKKIEQYMEGLEKFQISDDADGKKVELRDARAKVMTSIIVIQTITNTLNAILNQQHLLDAKKDIEPIHKVIAFARSLQSIAGYLDLTNIVKAVDDPALMASMGASIGKQINSRYADKPWDVHEDMDFIKKFESKFVEITNLFKSDYKTVPLSYPEAYTYLKNEFNGMSTTIKIASESDAWDFKTLAQKINAVQKELIEAIDNIPNDNQANSSKNVTDSMSIVLNNGKVMAKLKDLIAVSLKEFKGDCEVMFTEATKVGSLLYKKRG